MKILLLLIVALQISFAQVQSRKIVWIENFNGKSLAEKNWNFEIGDGCPQLCGWGNSESQIYTKTNHVLKNGKLIIQPKFVDGIFSSTRITTKSKREFQYGYVETRAKLPVGKGLWPAFWMLGSNISEIGWPKCGEIDILEYVGREPQTIFTSIHTADSFGNTVNTKKRIFPDIEKGFHIYGMDWSKDKISFFVDNELVYTFQPAAKNEKTWPFDKPFYLIINLAIGGNFGGREIDNDIIKQTFEIDYVKIYQ